MRLANRFVLVIQEFKFSAGEKSTALVVDAGASDHWNQPSLLGFFTDHETPRTRIAAPPLNTI